MYYHTVPREREPGASDFLKSKYINLGIRALEENSADLFFELAGRMAADFASVNTRKALPGIGIVGEIYVKYNDFANKGLIKWLIKQGIEPMVPPVTNFFIDGFANNDVRVRDNVSGRNMPKFLYDIAKNYILKMIDRMDSAVRKFPYNIRITDPDGDAKKAGRIINLNAQFGEGWRIAAELVHFAEAGINNVVSLQPFGCIANHIVSKGIEKRVRQLFPEMNILSLDFDSGVSDVNIHNRLHFMIRNAYSEKRTGIGISSAMV